jgi:hypothetical protein
LEGLFVPGSPESGVGAVVAPPHPLYGGTLSNPVVNALVSGLNSVGVASLAFNYRGVGRSEGQVSGDLGLAGEDYGAVLDELATRVPGPYLAAGYSFGSCAALATAAHDSRVSGAVLVAPPVTMLDADDLTAFSGRLLVIVGDGDGYAPLADLTSRLATRPDATIDIIEGADHFFTATGTAPIANTVATQVVGWF